MAAFTIEIFRGRPASGRLDADIRSRIEALAPSALDAAAGALDPEATARGAADLIEQLALHPALLAEVAARPEGVRRAVMIIGASV